MATTVDPTNTAMADAWDGSEGEYWATHVDEFDAGVAQHHARLMQALAIRPSDRVLDVGCGNGRVALDAAKLATSGHATGIDLSSRMVEVARGLARAESVDNADFLLADAQIHSFTPGSYDYVVSRFGAMFFGDRMAAFTNLGNALAPDGKLMLMVWQSPTANSWMLGIRQALALGREVPAPPPEAPSPFALADQERTTQLLRSCGYATPTFESVEVQMDFGPTVDGALDFMLGQHRWMLADLDAAQQERAIAALRALMTEHCGADGVRFDSASWIITATRA